MFQHDGMLITALGHNITIDNLDMSFFKEKVKVSSTN